MGIVTHIAEVLAKIKPTESLRLAKREARKKKHAQIPQVILRTIY
jgi:hypothetical protein